MKKIMILVFLMMIIQKIDAQEFHFGFQAAPTLGWFKPDYNESIGGANFSIKSSGSKIGFMYGLIMDFGFTPNYAVSTGANIVYRTGSLDYTTTLNTNSILYTRKYSLEYVEIPVLLKLKTNEIGYIKYYGQVGLSLGVNIRGRAEVDSTVSHPLYYTQGSQSNVNVMSDINPITMSMVIGAGIEYSLQGHTQLMLGLTFNNGFMDILKDKNMELNSNTYALKYSSITNYLALNVGIFF
ncbi:MAG: porin family protein [Bacteroidota bacterium]